ncbi:MAG TPA: VOC family protein [Woeseiaceae bacterium]|nr:VOC family protein [Woeseiaceae bacterium]
MPDTISVSVSIDVPKLVDGVRFYEAAFGFVKVAEPLPGIAVLRAGQAEICLLEKAPGSSPSGHTEEKRHYERHWTPVHMDLHVDDLKSVLASAMAAGAKQEQLFEIPKYPSVAFCSDPFGHGFCLIERRKK